MKMNLVNRLATMWFCSSSNRSMEAYITTPAGLGDVYHDYYFSKIWRQIDYIQSKHPDMKITLYSISNNHDCAEFFRHNPYISEIIEQPIDPEHSYTESLQMQLSGKINIRDMEQDDLLETYPEIYMSEWEEKICNHIRVTLLNNKYVFIHPYSSTAIKVIDKDIPLREYIDKIIDDYGYGVILAGKSHKFAEEWKDHGFGELNEIFDYHRPGLINFTKEFLTWNNSRVLGELCRTAEGAIISESAYLQLVKHVHVPHIVFLGKGTKEAYQKSIAQGDHFYTSLIDNYYYLDDPQNFDIILKNFMEKII